MIVYQHNTLMVSICLIIAFCSVARVQSVLLLLLLLVLYIPSLCQDNKNIKLQFSGRQRFYFSETSFYFFHSRPQPFFLHSRPQPFFHLTLCPQQVPLKIEHFPIFPRKIIVSFLKKISTFSYVNSKLQHFPMANSINQHCFHLPSLRSTQSRKTKNQVQLMNHQQ